MRIYISKAVSAAAVGLSFSLVLAGCTTIFKDRIVDLRNAQADAALENHNIPEAENEYALALRLSRNDEHARAGYVRAVYLHAKDYYANGKIDDAAREVQQGLKYAPKDAGLLDLASAIDQARIRRDILVGNFPSYKAIGDSIASLISANAVTNKDVQRELHLFHTDYDVTHLRKAIDLSSLLEEDQHRLTQRLLTYKTQVEAGAPATSQSTTTPESPGLLPIP